LGGFIQLCLSVEDRCFDLPIHNQGHFIGANYQAIGDVMAVGIGLNNFGKIFASIRTSPTLIGWPVGSFTIPSRNRRCRKFSEFYSACPDFSGPTLLIARLLVGRVSLPLPFFVSNNFNYHRGHGH
jgi:hypothetical protein